MGRRRPFPQIFRLVKELLRRLLILCADAESPQLFLCVDPYCDSVRFPVPGFLFLSFVVTCTHTKLSILHNDPPPLLIMHTR